MGSPTVHQAANVKECAERCHRGWSREFPGVLRVSRSTLQEDVAQW